MTREEADYDRWATMSSDDYYEMRHVGCCEEEEEDEEYELENL